MRGSAADRFVVRRETKSIFSAPGDGWARSMYFCGRDSLETGVHPHPSLSRSGRTTIAGEGSEPFSPSFSEKLGEKGWDEEVCALEAVQFGGKRDALDNLVMSAVARSLTDTLETALSSESVTLPIESKKEILAWLNERGW